MWWMIDWLTVNGVTVHWERQCELCQLPSVSVALDRTWTALSHVCPSSLNEWWQKCGIPFLFLKLSLSFLAPSPFALSFQATSPMSLSFPAVPLSLLPWVGIGTLFSEFPWLWSVGGPMSHWSDNGSGIPQRILLFVSSSLLSSNLSLSCYTFFLYTPTNRFLSFTAALSSTYASSLISSRFLPISPFTSCPSTSPPLTVLCWS